MKNKSATNNFESIENVEFYLIYAYSNTLKLAKFVKNTKYER